MNAKLDNKFGLSLNKTKYTSIDFPYIEQPVTSTSCLTNIDPSLVVGTVNPGFGSGTLWDFYESFYKERLLNDAIFNVAIVNPKDGAYPEVCLIDGEYYIIQGRHRLILSQLHGLKSIKVVVLK